MADEGVEIVVDCMFVKFGREYQGCIKDDDDWRDKHRDREAQEGYMGRGVMRFEGIWRREDDQWAREM
jgi:hypothetical protein